MVVQKMVNWYKSLGFCGWLRFRTLWFAHRFIRNSGLAEQWDFVLKYIPYIERDSKEVIDVGTTWSLFIYELAHRGYWTWGIDIKPYQENTRYKFNFLQMDIVRTKLQPNSTDIVTMISVLQFLDRHDIKAIEQIHRILKPKGLMLLTVPQDKYTYLDIKKLTNKYFHILEYQPCRGHLGMAFIKKEIK